MIPVATGAGLLKHHSFNPEQPRAVSLPPSSLNGDAKSLAESTNCYRLYFFGSVSSLPLDPPFDGDV